jgi:hypothetical protein
MDFTKVDRLHEALKAALFTASVEEDATPYEMLCATMRHCAWLLAAAVDEPDGTSAQMRTAITGHVRDVEGMALARLEILRDDA